MNLIKTYVHKGMHTTCTEARETKAIQVAADPDTLSNIAGWLGQTEGIVDVRLGKTHVEFDCHRFGTQIANVGDYICRLPNGPTCVSPADLFERLYEVSTVRSRLLEETQQVAKRLNALNAFMASPEFPGLPRPDKDLLYSQQRVMSKYVQILGKRLELIGEQFKHADQ